MAKGKGKKKKENPYLSEGDQQKYMGMGKDELLIEFKKHRADLLAEKKSKKSSQALKDAREEIKDFDENWSRNDELIEAQEKLAAIKADREAERKELIEEKKQLEFDFNESIKVFQAHFDFICNELSKRV